MSPPDEPLRDAAADARALFGAVPGLRARLQEWRPAICPIDEVLTWVPASAKVLDIGCGAGLLSGMIALRRAGTPHADAPIIGVDASPKAIEIARKLSGRLADLEFAAAASSPPIFHVTVSPDAWPSGPFGAVLMVDVLHHIPPAVQMEFVSAALARVAPGGRFVYKDMARAPWPHAVANRLHDAVVAREWIHYVDPREVTDLARRTGLQRVHVSHHRRWCYAHDLLVFERPAPDSLSA